MRHQHAGLGTIRGKPEAVDNIIQARLKDLQKIQTCQTAALQSDLIVAPELALQHTIDAAGALFGAQLTQIV
jgi:hypothetical protein